MTRSVPPPSGPSFRGGGSPRRSPWTGQRITALVLVILFAVFVLQNRDDATVQMLFFGLTAPQWALQLGSFAMGGVVVWLLLIRRARRR